MKRENNNDEKKKWNRERENEKIMRVMVDEKRREMTMMALSHHSICSLSYFLTFFNATFILCWLVLTCAYVCVSVSGFVFGSVLLSQLFIFFIIIIIIILTTVLHPVCFYGSQEEGLCHSCWGWYFALNSRHGGREKWVRREGDGRRKEEQKRTKKGWGSTRRKKKRRTRWGSNGKGMRRRGKWEERGKKVTK